MFFSSPKIYGPFTPHPDFSSNPLPLGGNGALPLNFSFEFIPLRLSFKKAVEIEF
jgi:hypothetical protein